MLSVMMRGSWFADLLRSHLLKSDKNMRRASIQSPVTDMFRALRVILSISIFCKGWNACLVANLYPQLL